MMRGLPCLALTCALSLAAAPAFAGKTDASKNHPKPDKTTPTRDKAQLALQRDLVSVLAPPGATRPLLCAALLARPLYHPPPRNRLTRLTDKQEARRVGE